MLILDPGDAINHGLRGFWPFDEGAGKIARDISPYKSHALAGTAPAHRITQRGPGGYISGGTGAQTAYNAGVRSNLAGLVLPQTIVAWVRRVDWAVTNPTIFARYRTFTGGGALATMLRLDSNAVTLYLVSSGGSYVSTSGGPTLSRDTGTRFVAAVVSGTLSSPSVTLWLDGTSTTHSPSALGTAEADLETWIGSSKFSVNGGANEAWEGDILGVRQWARALSPSEIRRLRGDPWAGTLRPRRRAIKASSGTTYNDSLTETLTLADTLANVLTAVATASASATAGDAVANTMTMPASASYAVTAGDSLANVLTALASASDAVTAGDAVANTLAMSASASDGATLGDGATGGLLQLASVSDGLTLSDGLAQALTAAVAAAGAVTVTDALTTVLAATEAVSDAVALSDTVMAVLAMLASVSETVTLADLLSEGGEPTWPAFVREGRRVAIPPDLRRALIEMDRRRAAIPGDRRQSPLPN